MRHDKQAGDLVRAIATKPSSSFVNTRWEIKVNVCYDRLWKRNDSDGAWLIFSSTDIVSLDSFLQTTKHLGTIIYFCTAFTMKSFRSVQLNLTFLVVGCCLSVYARPDGAPAEACSTMTPSHGVGWQENKCPFEISVDQVIPSFELLMSILFLFLFNHFLYIRRSFIKGKTSTSSWQSKVMWALMTRTLKDSKDSWSWSLTRLL